MASSFLVALLMWAPAAASADVLTLQNGVELKGIITDETKQDYTIEVAPRGYTTVGKEQVVKVVRASAKENKKVREEWQAQEEEKRLQEVDEEAFEERQRARGFVKVDGEWLTEEEAALRLYGDRLQRRRLQTGSSTVYNVTVVNQAAAAPSLTGFVVPHFQTPDPSRQFGHISSLRLDPVASLGTITHDRRGPVSTGLNPVASMGAGVVGGRSSSTGLNPVAPVGVGAAGW